MSRQQLGIRFQLHHPADRCLQISLTGIGQIGPAHRAHDDQIATHQHVLLGQVEHHMPGCMTRCVNDPHAEAADLQFLAIGQEAIRLPTGYGKGSGNGARMVLSFCASPGWISTLALGKRPVTTA